MVNSGFWFIVEAESQERENNVLSHFKNALCFPLFICVFIYCVALLALPRVLMHNSTSPVK